MTFLVIIIFISLSIKMTEFRGKAYSRRGAEVGAAGGDGEEDAAGVVGGHQGDEVGGGLALGLGLMGARSMTTILHFSAN